MRRKARDILRDQQGLSMILVLCIGALFVALSAALVYAASVLTANANRQLLEQEAYQLATSFSDVLEGELNTPTSSFAAFVNDSFMTSTAYGGDIYGSPSQPYSYTWKAADADTSGAEEITVTLRRRPGEDAEKLNLSGVGQSVSTKSGWRDQLTSWQSNDYLLTDLQLDVTVTATKAGESFAYTVTYDRQVHYPVSGYTFDDSTTVYTWSKGTSTFASPGLSSIYIKPEDAERIIVPHFDTTNPDKSTIHYTRGARQSTSTGVSRHETQIAKSARRDHCRGHRLLYAAVDVHSHVCGVAAVRPGHVPKGRDAAGDGLRFLRRAVPAGKTGPRLADRKNRAELYLQRGRGGRGVHRGRCGTGPGGDPNRSERERRHDHHRDAHLPPLRQGSRGGNAMKQLQNKRGTTLVELIVCMVLLSILTLAAVTLIRPSAQAYRDIQQQTRAQNLADALIETIRGEVLDANGYIRFTNGATDSANLDSVFDAQTSYSDGTALEFSVYPNHVELIDKDLVPALKNSKGKDLLTQAQAEELNGYLHMRFYQQEQRDFAPLHEKDGEKIAYAYTTAYPKESYMGLYISDLHFYARSWAQENDTDTPRITAMTVVITVAKRDSSGNDVPLCTQKAIVPLPGEPVILYAPGTWNGKASSER